MLQLLRCCVAATIPLSVWIIYNDVDNPYTLCNNEAIDQPYQRSDNVLLITMTSTQCSPCCPLCGMKAGRVHSCYTRKLTDLPCGGQPVRLLLQVRKYFCENPD